MIMIGERGQVSQGTPWPAVRRINRTAIHESGEEEADRPANAGKEERFKDKLQLDITLAGAQGILMPISRSVLLPQHT